MRINVSHFPDLPLRVGELLVEHRVGLARGLTLGLEIPLPRGEVPVHFPRGSHVRGRESVQENSGPSLLPVLTTS